MNPTRLATFAVVLFTGIFAWHTLQAQTVPLIPRPAHSTLGKESADISHGIAFDSSNTNADTAFILRYLQQLLNTTHGPKIVSIGTKAAPRLLFIPRPAEGASGNPKDESYELKLTPGEIRITAASRAGFLYGAISLWQILSHADGRVDGWAIEDAPSFRWRGLMLDSARHMQSEAFILQLLDYMAEHKLNVFHWHLTDDQGWRLEIKRYPRLTSVAAYRPQTMPAYQPDATVPSGPYGGFYTQAQVRRIVAYAKDRNITIVPEIEMPGHATAALVAYPQFGSAATPLNAMPVGWGVFPGLFSPFDNSLQFLKDILLEVMDLFPGEYIHLGGDEASKEQWKANPAIQQKIHTLGLKDEDALQAWFMTQMEGFLNQHGRKMVGWDEILEGGVSKNAIVMSWRGLQGGIAAAKLGHDAVLTPSRPLYFNYRQSGTRDEPPGRDPINSLADVYNFQAKPPELDRDEQAHILGVQGTLWTEYVLAEDRLQHMLFPRAAALAEVAWSPAEGRDFKDFLLRLPSDNQRAEDAGVHPALTVFEVNAKITPTTDGKGASIMLSTQGQAGEIHYTLDGSPAQASSTAYKEAFQVTFPMPLHAAAFVGGMSLGSPAIQQLTLAAALARDSRELDPCQGGAGIQLEQDPLRSLVQPVFRVVYSDPCWIYRSAPMSLFSSFKISVGSIPYIFHSPDRAMPQPEVSSSTTARLAVYSDTCAGKLLTKVPLQPAFRKDGEVTLPAVSFEPQQGFHDICFKVEASDPATVWLLHTVQPIPH